jgi:hypothetical protein
MEDTKIKIGVLTDKPEPVSGFDFTSYYRKTCTGKINKTGDHVINIINCFEDNRTARKKPEWVALSATGKAVRTNKNHRFLWDHICPNVDEYKTFLIDLINETLRSDCAGVHLEGIGFPESGYCSCERCIDKQKTSNLEESKWRSLIVTEFIKEASKIVKETKKSFSVTLMPDPCFGEERYGQDVISLSKFVDFFIVPLYDLVYSTTYWLETLAYAFQHQLKKPLYIELYATNPGPNLKNLLAAVVAVSKHCNGIIFATHDSCLAKEIQEKLVKNNEFSKFLERYGRKSILKIIEKWKK